MQDLISRQEAIDALAEVARDRFNLQDTFQECLDALNDAESKIKRLPSAHCDNCPYPDEYVKEKEDALRWIPVSERLPENDYAVLVYEPGGDEFSVYAARYDKEYGWEYRDDMSTAIPPKPIAWMPLPEPYKEEE